MKTVFKSTQGTETELVRAQLEGAGFHPRVLGSPQASGLMLIIGGFESEVAVPTEEFEAARTYLVDSKLVLDETVPSGVIPDGAVCPVHELAAVAACERCGTFLCARCGSLGTPPLCEGCIARPEEARQRPTWVTATARLWAFVWIGTLLLGALTTLALMAGRLRR